MAPWKHGLGGGKGRGRSFYYALAEEAVRRDGSGTSYAKKLFDERSKYGLSNEEIASLSGNLFGAGSDTSSSTLITFILACCAFPEVLPKAWEELDRVVGPYRSPGLDDDLPYIRAFVKEVFRWRSVAIIGGQPHAPIQDDYYNVGRLWKCDFEGLALTAGRNGTSQRTPGCRAMCGPFTEMRTSSPSQIDSAQTDSSKAIDCTARSPTIKVT